MVQPTLWLHLLPPPSMAADAVVRMGKVQPNPLLLLMLLVFHGAAAEAGVTAAAGG
jgi:hypothetical protein